MRRFERVRDDAIQYGVFDVKMPQRATKHSAGYDFYSPIEVSIPSNSTELIWTNIKASFEKDEVLLTAVTSGMGGRGLMLANNLGVIDCDYYNNEFNDGNLGLRLYNFGKESYTIKKGDKIGQGLFVKFLQVEDETEVTSVRKGGFGSTDKK